MKFIPRKVIDTNGGEWLVQEVGTITLDGKNHEKVWWVSPAEAVLKVQIYRIAVTAELYALVVRDRLMGRVSYELSRFVVIQEIVDATLL